MHLSIDEHLGLDKVTGKPTFAVDNGNMAIMLFGEFDGIYDDGRIADPQESFNWLVGAGNNGTMLEQMLTQSVGSFILVVQSPNDIQVYTSPRGPGFFWTKEKECIHIIDNEMEFYKLVSDRTVNDYEVLHAILHKFSFRSPFTTLFEGTQRVIGGQVLNVRSKLGYKQRFYLPLSGFNSAQCKLDDLFDDFKTILESLTHNAFRHHQRSTNYVQVSGGIDSTIVLIAAQAMGINLTPLHWRKNRHLSQDVELLCTLLGTKPHYFGAYYDEDPDTWWKPYLQNALHFYGSGLGILGLKNMYLLPEYVNEQPLSLGGHTIGVLYQGHPAMFPYFGQSYPRRAIRDTISGKPKRFLYTSDFRKLVAKRTTRCLPNKLASKGYRFPDSQYEYLLALALTNKFPLMPNRVLPPELREHEEDFVNYRSQVILNPIVGMDQISQLYKGHDNSRNTLDIATRLLRFSMNVQSATLNTINHEKAGGFKQIDPAVQGPMIHLLHKLPIGYREVCSPKALEFLYMKHQTGYDYYKDFISRTRRKFWLRDLGSEAKKRLRSDASAKSQSKLLESRQFQNNFQPLADASDSVVLDSLNDSSIKDFVQRLYRQIQQEEYPDFFTVNQILNLEIFLKTIS